MDVTEVKGLMGLPNRTSIVRSRASVGILSYLHRIPMPHRRRSWLQLLLLHADVDDLARPPNYTLSVPTTLRSFLYTVSTGLARFRSSCYGTPYFVGLVLALFCAGLICFALVSYRHYLRPMHARSTWTTAPTYPHARAVSSSTQRVTHRRYRACAPP